ncbi:MAG: hypothetical protein B7Z31_10145, partial [Rhodobacterales bacterium 12-65-15]
MQRIGKISRLGLFLCVSTLALSACVSDNGLDWDLRAGGGDTSDAARQATAAAPTPDTNGIISYPDYQLATARRGESVASMAGRLGLNADDLAQANALRPTDPLREGELLLLPSRVAAAGQPTTVGGGVDISAIATTALDAAGPSGTVAGSAPVSGQPL